MESAQRIVTHLPLVDLWDATGPVQATRRRDLTTADLRQMLQLGQVQFLVANVADPLRWVPLGDCFSFWKTELQRRIADSEKVYLEDYPGGYCYFASEWAAHERPPIVLLTVAH